MRTQLWQLACLYWTTANLLAFALMGLDKRRARRAVGAFRRRPCSSFPSWAVPWGDAGDVLFPPQDPPLVFSGRLPSPVSVPGAPALLSVAVAGALICLEQAVPAVRTSCPLTTGKVHTCRTSRIFSHTCRRKSRFNSLCQKVLQGPFGSL